MSKIILFVLLSLILTSCDKFSVSKPPTSNSVTIADGSIGTEKFKFTLNTTNVPEGTNLYFTNSRAISALATTLLDYVSTATLGNFAGAFASKTQVVDCASVGTGTCIVNATSNSIKVKDYTGNLIKIGNLLEGGNYRVTIPDELNTELSLQSLDPSLAIHTLDPVVFRTPGRSMSFEIRRVENDIYVLYNEYNLQ